MVLCHTHSTLRGGHRASESLPHGLCIEMLQKCRTFLFFCKICQKILITFVKKDSEYLGSNFQFLNLIFLDLLAGNDVR